MGKRGSKSNYPLLRRIEELGKTVEQVSAESGISASRIRNLARGNGRLLRREVKPLYIAIEGREAWEALR